jgi:tetratricopeptide (TPR) repeat protein
MEPKEALFHSLSGDIYAGNDDFKKAETAYNKAVQLDDNFFYHYLRRGQARYERRKFDAARVDLEHSLELLPTAQANYLLGNMDKRAGNMESAIKHYQAAAQSGSQVSKQAQKELVLLELPSNPGKYIQSKAVMGEGNYVNAAVRNNSPVTVNGIRVKVEYIDANGQLRESSMNFRKTLGPGEWTALPTKIRDIADSNELARRVRVTVIGAKIVEEQKNLRS